jgi:D-alanine-D-alanine ligase
MAKLNVAVLMGGASAERDISLSTGRQILQALDAERYCVYALDTHPTLALPAQMPDHVRLMRSAEGNAVETSLTRLPLVAASSRPDVVIIALHGKGGEDGTVQGFLETLGIPYTGSGVLASALAMDKARCKTFLAASGVRVPEGIDLRRGDPVPDLPLPRVVKPALQGSSDGVSIVEAGGDLNAAVAMARQYDDCVLIEEYIRGTEITCAVLGNEAPEALPLIEIVPAKGVYDREAKYTPGATDEICPARLSGDVASKAREIALTCHRALGCRGMSRTDMIVDASGDVYTLEINTIPGMTPTSLLPRAASVAGYTFSALLDKLIGFALER